MVSVHPEPSRPVTMTIMTNGSRGLADCEESKSDNSLGKLLVLPFLAIKWHSRERFSNYVSPHTAVARASGRCSEISIL